MNIAKKLHSIAFVMLLSAIPALAQNTVYYSYDAAGNRVRREIVLNQQNAPQHPARADVILPLFGYFVL